MTPLRPDHTLPVSPNLPPGDLAPAPMLTGTRIPGKTWLAYVRPEDAGFSSAKLVAARTYWETIDSAAFFVVYRGAVVVDWGETTRRFRCHSVRKSFMSAMYGMAIDRGVIDPMHTLEQCGIDDDPPLTIEEKQARIVDLLSARSGVYRAAAYESSLNPKPPRGSHPPGTHWVYNNWDFNTLLTIFEQATGAQFFDAFDHWVAKPLGMQDYHPRHGWYFYERDKSIHPAYPLRMSARDMARFGLLYLAKGQWGPQRLLSEAYVAQSTSRVSDHTWEPGGYGYMWWLHDSEPFRTLGMYSAMGNGGHSIDVIPGAELVCVNRVNTYEEGHLVSLEHCYRLLRLLLDARVEEADTAPALVPLTASARVPPPAPLSAAPRAAYCMEVPYPDWRQKLANFEMLVGVEKIAIFEEERQLWVNFGEGPVPLHPLNVDHFLAEDYEAHLYFETAPDGAKTLIDVYLLLQQGRVHLAQGQLDAALAVYDKAARYYPDKPYVYQALAEAYWHQAQPALASAVHHYRRLNALRPQETLDRSLLSWELITLQAAMMPPALSPAHLARLAGTYGPRRVTYVDGHLLYSRDGRPPVQLIPLTDTMFALEGNPATRLRFDVDAAGRVFRITGLSRSGLRDETFRDA